jgi:hypothetical protein
LAAQRGIFRRQAIMEHDGNTFVFQKDSSYVSAAAAKLIAQ